MRKIQVHFVTVTGLLPGYYLAQAEGSADLYRFWWSSVERKYHSEQITAIPMSEVETISAPLIANRSEGLTIISSQLWEAFQCRFGRVELANVGFTYQHPAPVASSESIEAFLSANTAALEAEAALSKVAVLMREAGAGDLRSVAEGCHRLIEDMRLNILRRYESIGGQRR